MEDGKIIELYWQRDQNAIMHTDKKYGGLCKKISYNILSNVEDCEECVSDTYMTVWNRLPPQRPKCFPAFISSITRNLSLMRVRKHYAKKRGGGELSLVLDELGDTFAAPDSVEGEYECKELAYAVSLFLGALSADERDMFISRYWLVMPVQYIAQRLNCSCGKVSTSLFRTRQKLQRYLSKEGLI